MGEIEPMTVEEIKGIIAGMHRVYFDPRTQGSEKGELVRLILAFVGAEAELRYWTKPFLGVHSLKIYRNEVLDEIGWPKEGR